MKYSNQNWTHNWPAWWCLPEGAVTLSSLHPSWNRGLITPCLPLTSDLWPGLLSRALTSRLVAPTRRPVSGQTDRGRQSLWRGRDSDWTFWNRVASVGLWRFTSTAPNRFSKVDVVLYTADFGLLFSFVFTFWLLFVKSMAEAILKQLRSWLAKIETVATCKVFLMPRRLPINLTWNFSEIYFENLVGSKHNWENWKIYLDWETSSHFLIKCSFALITGVIRDCTYQIFVEIPTIKINIIIKIHFQRLLPGSVSIIKS